MLGGSVVPDLMQVYESLTQSSTPQFSSSSALASTANAAVTYHHHHPKPQQQQQQQQQQHPTNNCISNNKSGAVATRTSTAPIVAVSTVKLNSSNAAVAISAPGALPSADGAWAVPTSAVDTAATYASNPANIMMATHGKQHSQQQPQEQGQQQHRNCYQQITQGIYSNDNTVRQNYHHQQVQQQEISPIGVDKHQFSGSQQHHQPKQLMSATTSPIIVPMQPTLSTEKHQQQQMSSATFYPSVTYQRHTEYTDSSVAQPSTIAEQRQHHLQQQQQQLQQPSLQLANTCDHQQHSQQELKLLQHQQPYHHQQQQTQQGGYTALLQPLPAKYRPQQQQPQHLQQNTIPTFNTTSSIVAPVTQSKLSRKRSKPSTASLDAPPNTIKAAASNTINNFHINNASVPQPSLSSRKKGGSNNSSNNSKQSSQQPSNNDGRWSKRFTWPEELHRDFVAAVFDVGLKHSSPSAIMEHMTTHINVTSERVKSRLQKYRLHREKSKMDYMTSYDASLLRLKFTTGDDVSDSMGYNSKILPKTITAQQKGDGNNVHNSFAPGDIESENEGKSNKRRKSKRGPSLGTDNISPRHHQKLHAADWMTNGVKSLSSAEVAAHLTYTCMMADGNTHNQPITSPIAEGLSSGNASVQLHHTLSTTLSSQQQNFPKIAPTASADSIGEGSEGILLDSGNSNDIVRSNDCDIKDGSGGALVLPQLTEQEKCSPLGASMGYLMGLFFSLRQQIMDQRSKSAATLQHNLCQPDTTQQHLLQEQQLQQTQQLHPKSGLTRNSSSSFGTVNVPPIGAAFVQEMNANMIRNKISNDNVTASEKEKNVIVKDNSKNITTPSLLKGANTSLSFAATSNKSNIGACPTTNAALTQDKHPLQQHQQEELPSFAGQTHKQQPLQQPPLSKSAFNQSAHQVQQQHVPNPLQSHQQRAPTPFSSSYQTLQPAKTQKLPMQQEQHQPQASIESQSKQANEPIKEQPQNHQQQQQQQMGALLSSSSKSNNTTKCIDQSRLMNKDIKVQKDFQSKMRALKQQELSKYQNSASDDNNNSISNQQNFSPFPFVPPAAAGLADVAKFKNEEGGVYAEVEKLQIDASSSRNNGNGGNGNTISVASNTMGNKNIESLLPTSLLQHQLEQQHPNNIRNTNNYNNDINSDKSKSTSNSVLLTGREGISGNNNDHSAPKDTNSKQPPSTGGISLSILDDNSDFWKETSDDEQLFEFLMDG
eukprot:CAMPEP_0194360420 /NCGR_PEP_ID=MMETSP0174-20130528/7760_1 /TAXON_ID=216777 /ORGANISM="Proboscia alata, Strain PI-D3" /LENGTH=1217 /DNA_ID=CAMNT_0039131899 /DNA_START=387 /DNA_END=4040 /DNA_ORIENTATION=+